MADPKDVFRCVVVNALNKYREQNTRRFFAC